MKLEKQNPIKSKDFETEKEMYRVLGIPSEPNSGEVAPTELALNNIATILEGVADSNSVVTSASIILGAFVLGREIAALAPLLFVLVPHFDGIRRRNNLFVT